MTTSHKKNKKNFGGFDEKRGRWFKGQKTGNKQRKQQITPLQHVQVPVTRHNLLPTVLPIDVVIIVIIIIITCRRLHFFSSSRE
jgi:hypothetical protein